jgi:CBS-domain-containing membrane protein
MPATTKSLQQLTAEDLMTRDVVRLPQTMPLREAARLLWRNHVGGAPVVDGQGACIGVLSATDFLRLAERRVDVTRPTAPLLPVTCAFQTKHRTESGQEVMLCTLPPGVCPIQTRKSGAPGEELLICTAPNCVLVDWQTVDLERLPEDEVRQFMTADAVTVRPGTPIRTLARMMIDAHIHRIIVVNDERWPLGIVSSTDLLAVLAYGDEPSGGDIDSEC